MTFFIITLLTLSIVLAILLMKKSKENKRNILSAENYRKSFENFKEEFKNTTAYSVVELECKKSALEDETTNISNKIKTLNEELKAFIGESNQKKVALRKELANYQNKIDDTQRKLKRAENNLDIVVEYGFYAPLYTAMSSGEYANLINRVRDKQKSVVANKKATSFCAEWTVGGSLKEGERMTNDNIKLMLRAFNYECDTIIAKIKHNNFEASVKRIKKSADAINKLGRRNKIAILNEYVDLKIEEAHLCYEYSLAVQEEKEKLKAAKAEERERAKVEKELAEARKSLEKERVHYENARNDILNKIKECENQEEKKAFESKLNALNAHLEQVAKSIEDVDYRESNNKAGYVYIISNVGSFGKDIYKIGMTRRLEPMDRVDELGDASVPFKFDVHAMIFSDDAPALEAALHNAFDDKKVNMVNGRKEFFNVSLEEIEAVVKANHDKAVKFTYEAEAPQYRESMRVRSK